MKGVPSGLNYGCLLSTQDNANPRRFEDRFGRCQPDDQIEYVILIQNTKIENYLYNQVALVQSKFLEARCVSTMEHVGCQIAWVMEGTQVYRYLTGKYSGRALVGVESRDQSFHCDVPRRQYPNRTHVVSLSPHALLPGRLTNTLIANQLRVLWRSLPPIEYKVKITDFS